MASNNKFESNLLKEIPAHDRLPGAASVSLTDLTHKVHRNVEDYGWHITVKKALAYLGRWIYFRQVYRIYRINLDAIKAHNTPAGQHFTFKLLTPQNVDMIAQVENTAEWLRGQVQERIAAGQLCLVALDGDKVAGFNLINLKQASLVLVNRRKLLRQGDAWSEHIAVKKEFRRTGLGAQLRFKLFDELKSRGIHRFYGGTLRSNTASLKLTRSVGFKEICDIQYVKLLFFENWKYKRVREQ